MRLIWSLWVQGYIGIYIYIYIYIYIVLSGNCLRGFITSQVLLCGDYAGFLSECVFSISVKVALASIFDQQYRSFENYYAGLRKIHVLLLRGWEEGVWGQGTCSPWCGLGAALPTSQTNGKHKKSWHLQCSRGILGTSNPFKTCGKCNTNVEFIASLGIDHGTLISPQRV